MEELAEILCLVAKVVFTVIIVVSISGAIINVLVFGFIWKLLGW